MKKAMLGFIASAMSLLATTAQAYDGVGDIRSIDPCDQYGYVIGNGSMAQPYTAGQTAYFRIRLENVNSRESWETKDTSKLSNPWCFQYTGIGVDSALEWAINPPKVGVYVSGQLRGATVVSALSPADKAWYTDILCSYTVRPGDLALPMTLANQAGKEMGDGSASEYYLDTIPRSGVWRLMAYERESASTWDTVVATKTCTFKYGETQFFNANASAASEMTEWTTDYALKQAGLYIKSVDFAASEYSVGEGRTERVNVAIVGGVNTNGNGTVYAMIKDGDAVALAEDSVEVVTVAEDPNGDTDVAYQVAKVTIPSGEDVDSFSFKVRGVTQGAESIVYLSTTKSFAYGDSHDLVTNFVTAVVKCVAPPPPYIAVTLDDKASLTVSSGPDFSNYAAKLTVTLSEAHSSDVTVDIEPSMRSGSGTPPLGKYIGMSTYSENGFSHTTTSIKFTAAEMASGTLSKNLYVYVLGADDDTDSIDKGIEFMPKNVAIYNDNLSAILYIQKSTPMIVSPADGTEYPSVNGGVDTMFTIKVSDDYMNSKGVYTIEWLRDGVGEPVSGLSGTPDSKGEIPVKLKYNAAGTYHTKFRVINSSGTPSEWKNITVVVKEPKSMWIETADGATLGRCGEDAEVLSLNFRLSEAYDDSSDPIFAFLVPQNAASSNYVDCLAIESGVAIFPGDAGTMDPVDLTILDGNKDTGSLSYAIELHEQNDLSSKTIEKYVSKTFYLKITNTPPRINAVLMGADSLYENGGRFRSTASVRSAKTFSLEIDDVELDLESTELVNWVWTFNSSDGRNPRKYEGKSPLNSITTNITFALSGIYTGSVKIQDKDMGSKYGEVFNFEVEVRDQPSINIAFEGNNNTFAETDAMTGKAFFNVQLTDPATSDIKVQLEITNNGGDGVLEVGSTVLDFTSGETNKVVRITDLDGTPLTRSNSGCFTVKAKVITDTLNEDNVKWSEVYQQGDAYIYIVNEAPQVLLPFDNGRTNNVAVNVPVQIKWSVTDVPEDLLTGLDIEWEVEGKFYTFHEATGVFTNIFTTGGTKTITMTAMDKDGDRSEPIYILYEVTPAKIVNAYPSGPCSGSKPYSAAVNMGMGRICGLNALPIVTGFAHKYSYGATESDATFVAYGYKSGQIDDGTLKDVFGNSGKDIAIGSSGNSFSVGEDPVNCFTYADDLDSFFYAWVYSVTESSSSNGGGSSGGGSTETTKVELNPENPANRYFEPSITISLPGEKLGDSTASSYASSKVWAYFSRELYKEDNMGDINADGIPDFYATMKWVSDLGGSKTIAEAETGTESASESEEGSESTVAIDLTIVRDHNSDGDFLPMAFSSANPLNPEIKDWGPGVRKFDARLEIRGLHEGLNYPGVSEYHLSEAETYALFADCATSGVALTGTYEENYVAATNWAKSTGWTPEAIDKTTGSRLNPLAADTDGDGFDDGWEYYFWYHAKVGAVVNGKWARLEGRRFDPTSPTLYTRISPEEIVAAFDPHVARYSGDLDNDGLTDFEEYVLGTNPVCFDLNGDSVPELYKVMNGINPASPFYNEGNPDRDFMARCEYDGDTFTVFTFDNGDMFALPTKTSPSAKVIADEERKASVWKVEFVSKEVAYFATLPAVIPGATEGSLLLASDATGNLSVTFDAAEYLGQTKTFVAGTPVKSVATEAVEMSPAVLDAEGFAWTDPDTIQASRTKNALPLFNYGGDGVTLVPCTTDVTTYALAPADVGAASLIKVETDKKITLIHYQVLCQYGFDPRTAWNIDDFGFVDQRWRKLDSIEEDTLGQAGLATRTAPYTTRDEFLVSQYRREMRNIGEDGVRSATESILNGGYLEYAGSADITYLQSMTTYPNLPVSFIRAWYATRQQISPFENSTNDTIIAYWEYLEQEHEVHGADTDYDGIPDGWELYVNANPNDNLDAKARDGWAKDGDNLNILEEYVGVDSCNAYTNKYSVSDPNVIVYPEVTTITRNNPGKTMNWWNKFFPTNPYDQDTDGDGINDHTEGKGWSTDFYVGNHWYGTQSATFIYGTDEKFAKYAEDGATTCFRGGGLNPCTVDTDGDLLPDAWEAQFAGILFTDGETKVALLNKDKQILASADGKQGNLSATGCEIRGGMDGTFSGDACYDFDHDGLVNCQEYLVQSLRHLRYDDCLTPLMGIDPGKKQFVNFIKFSAWDGEAFHKRCLENGFPGLGTWQFAELGYFTRPPHEWDMLWQNKSGQNQCKNYDDPGYRVMLPPIWYCADGSKLRLWHGGVRHYASTDPRRWDSDEDGMDDFWEIFHGLNPLLGSAADPLENGEYDWPNTRYDVIGNSSGGNVNAWFNHWTDWKLGACPEFDALKYPWMMGTMECDADGDGLRNDEESIKVNLAKPQNTHTDPTPLWMTDSKGAASVTAQYYDPDPYVSELYTGSNIDPYPDIYNYPWKDMTLRYRLAAFGMGGRNPIWMFSFEENEGYDTDHDFRTDAKELSHDGINMASDPKNHTDLDRRQALYFPGNESAAVSYGGEFRRSPSTEPDLLKQFTVECWVMADAEIPLNKTILERVCNYGASTLINNQPVIKANFRIGTDGSGRLFGEFEGTTANAPSVRVTAPNELQPNKWTHVAFRFDGSTAYLHIDGNLVPVASADGLGLIPANGIDGIQQEYDQSVIEFVGYRALPCATVLGASIVGTAGFSLSDATTWDNYGKYFKGWVDEVRIWDGARTPVQINSDYAKRYTMDYIKHLRSNEDSTGVYDMWAGGATRSGKESLALPAELLQHYNFTSLPGAVDGADVITEPNAFKDNVLRNLRRPNGGNLDRFAKVGWWSGLQVKSTVYTSDWIVPWIGNTVAHMPPLDGSSPDSQYWSTSIAGVNLATVEGFASYDYPNQAMPYSQYVFRNERNNRYNLLSAVELGGSTTNVATDLSKTIFKKWEFQLRSEFVGTSDLVPIGGAFAKRAASFWDGQGAMDVWTETGKDSDGDGIPDWADANDGDMATEEEKRAYLGALVDGLLPDGTTDSAYVSKADVNNDGISDWWQNMQGLSSSAGDDTDNDGLADFAEYLVSEVFFTNVVSNPKLPKSNGEELDYFLRPEGSRLYLGEMFTDHDHIEDCFERDWSEIGAVPQYYDAHTDVDENGWSNWADIRAKHDMGFAIGKTEQVKTNVIIKSYVCYTEYEQQVEYLLNRPVDEELVECDFVIEDLGHWDTDESHEWPVWHDDFYGVGYIKWYKLTPVYAKTYAYNGHPIPTVELTIRYNGKQDLTSRPISVRAYSDDALTMCDAEFVFPSGTMRDVNTYTLIGATEGYLREGKNTFVVSVGAASNVTATAGSIMGVVRNVDVGWSKVKFEVELTENTPVCQRSALPAISTNGTSMAYVYRYSVDGIAPMASMDYGPILVKDFGARGYFHEGDLLSDTGYDLDWDGFESAILDNITVSFNDLPVTNVVYRVYPCMVDIDSEAISTNATPYVEIVREFGAERAKAVPVAPGEDSTIYYGGQPTFRWKVEGDRPDTYTAFAIKVTDASGEVWNSGTQMLPPKNSNGEYAWTAPLYVGDQTLLGKVFGSRANYKWSVIMYNAKYQGNDDIDWSDERNFRVNIYGEKEPNNAGFYALDIDVKYFGPGAFDADVGAVNGKIRVEAFTSPDFSGMPAGRAFITNLASVTASDHVRNVRIAGLAAGKYYVRAYIDTDGDFCRSVWESWGYACDRGGTETGAIYAPAGFEVGDGIATPLASLYVEDADVDQDALPDVWEYDEWLKNKAGYDVEDFLLKQGPMENVNDGYIAVNPELVADILRAVSANGGSSMMSLAASGYMPSAMAAMMLGVDSVEPEIEEGTLGITAFSLDGDTVKLTVGAKADDPLAGSVFVSDGKVTATVVVLHATSLAEGFAELKSVDVTFDIEEGAVSHTESISLKDILGEDVDLSKGFFKVELK